MKIPSGLRFLIYFVSMALLLSGVAWELLDRYFEVSSAFGVIKNPAEPWVLKIHGAMALAAVFLFGFLFSSHLRVGWRAKRKRFSGSTLAGSITALILSGYLLYYAGGDEFRAAVSFTHFWLGVLSPLPFLVHLLVRANRRSS